MKPTDKQVFVANIARQHGRRLRQFVSSRLRRSAAEAPDLVQEVYLRLLRIDHHETIRSSEAYLFTIASHVLHQHTMRKAAAPEAVELTEFVAEMQAETDQDPARAAETQQRMDKLRDALSRLSPKARATLLLHRRDGYSLEEIAGQLGISRPMAAKYLGKALLHCRQRLEDKDAP